MKADDPRHGSVAGYVAKCRCDDCRNAWKLNHRNSRSRRYLAGGPLVIDATGTRRRLRALVALGWSLKELDVEIGRATTYCSYLLRRKGDIFRTTAEEVAVLYERLCMTRPEGWIADRQRRLAASRGWAPPLGWDDIDKDEVSNEGEVSAEEWNDTIDEVVIDRLLSGGGRARKLTHAEASVVVHRLLARGHSTTEIEDWYGFKPERYVRLGDRGVA